MPNLDLGYLKKQAEVGNRYLCDAGDRRKRFISCDLVLASRIDVGMRDNVILIDARSLAGGKQEGHGKT